MSLNEAIMLALATGAAARMHPNGHALKRSEVAAYQELLDLLSNSYSRVNAHMMEVGPGSQERQQLLAEQLQKNGVDADERVLRQSRHVLQEVLARAPQAIGATAAGADSVSQALEIIEEKLEIR